MIYLFCLFSPIFNFICLRKVNSFQKFKFKKNFFSTKYFLYEKKKIINFAYFPFIF